MSVPRVDRREFLAGLSGLVLVASVSRIAKAADAPKYGADAMEHGWRDDPLTFVAIGEDGIVTVVVHRSEMGQGIRTGLPLVVADELEADWSKVRVTQAPGDEEKFGNQDTDGSRSMRHHFDPMRRCGAAARTMLEAAAAATWNVPVSSVRAVNHEVIHQESGRRLGYGALARAAAKLPVPSRESLRLKNPSQFRYIGKDNIALLDGPDIANGRAQYGIDVRLDGMLYAVIARSPVFGGKVARFDAAAAQAIPGVVKVIEIPGTAGPPQFQPLNGVAVIAEDTWTAMKGRQALQDRLERRRARLVRLDRVSPRARAGGAQARQSAARGGRLRCRDGEGGAQGRSRVLLAAHRARHDGAAERRSANRRRPLRSLGADAGAASDARGVAKRLGLPVEKVTVHVTLLGGGFGRKSKPDFATEAALLSQQMAGRPVKVVWTRDDDLHHDYFHTVSVERLQAGLDAKGKPTAWLHRSVAPTIVSTFAPDPKHEAAFETGMGLINVPFDVPNLRIENPPAVAHTRVGWFRSVSNVPHAFAVQSFVAELAAAAGRDHRDYLLDLIGPARRIDPAALKDSWNHGESPERYPVDTGRLRRVIETATREAGWGRKLPKGQGLGLAAHYSFVSYVATVVAVEVNEQGQVSIPRVDIAFDCGPQVFPDRIRSQLEGAVIMGVSLAMLGEITFKDGRVQQDNFNTYQLTRMNESPRDIRVHLLPASDWSMPLGGVGEPGVPPMAPALCNAIFAATGKRIRQLPIAGQLAT